MENMFCYMQPYALAVPNNKFKAALELWLLFLMELVFSNVPVALWAQGFQYTKQVQQVKVQNLP